MSQALIVDDSRTSAALLGKILARRDLSSDKVESGEACLEYLASASPDIIFMDHMMPGMDGFEAVKAIKSQARLATIPIVMYTSKSGEVYRGQARALGAVGVLEKPATEADVGELLEQIQRQAAGETVSEQKLDPMQPAPGHSNARLAKGSAPELPGWASTRDSVANDCRVGRPVLENALVVDDSRTSAALLAKMLGRHGFVADKVDSGEACLDYLANHNPDIIFMDHMMPGMDGFDAVKAIKRQSRLAAIPIVMYTSKGGEMYIGQARALGAVGVLEKPASEEALLTLIAELQPGEEMPAPATRVEQIEIEQYEQAVEESSSSDSPPVESQDPTPLPTPPPYTDIPAPQRSQPYWRGKRLLILCMALLAALYLIARPGDDSASNSSQLLDSLSDLANQQAQYEFNSIPFDEQRLDVLRNVVSVLQLTENSAEIELRAHVGEFCRVYGDAGNAVLPGPAVPIEQCDMIGYEAGEAQALALSQSPGFTRFVDKVNSSGTGIHISLVAVGIFEPLAAYPAETEITRASDWNHAAQRNQRVEFVLHQKPVD